MSVRANWFANADSDASTDQTDDPFADMTTASGRKAITVKSTAEEFDAAFRRLNRWFARLTKMGISCPLRESGECHCSACPISQLHNPDAERHLLCKQGVEEERTIMLARVSRAEPAASGV